MTRRQKKKKYVEGINWPSANNPRRREMGRNNKFLVMERTEADGRQTSWFCEIECASFAFDAGSRIEIVKSLRLLLYGGMKI